MKFDFKWLVFRSPLYLNGRNCNCTQSLYCPIQWGLEYRTCWVFGWSMAFGSWSRVFEIRTKKFEVSLDHFIFTKKIIFCIKRPRLVAIFPFRFRKKIFVISLDQFQKRKIVIVCIKRPRLVTIFPSKTERSKTERSKTEL